MYAPFFGLKHEPFSIAPDPRYLFMSERHREALAHLLYGVNGGGGFVLLSGEIGAGKTTVCRCFLEQVPRRCNVAYIFNPKLTVPELLRSVCEEFGIPQPANAAATVKDFLDPLNDFLLKTHAVGQNNVLIIDEAQMLSPEVLEQLRLLTNLETNERKLLQIVLIGQPELRDLLARPELEQLAQRVIARYHLGALSEAETAAYIRHRLTIAGMTSALPFDAKALRRIHQLAAGVPRRINLLCDRALLGAYARGQAQVDREVVDKAAAEVFGAERAAAPLRLATGWPVRAALGLIGVAAAAAVTSAFVMALRAPRTPAPALAALAAHVASAPSAPAGAGVEASGAAAATAPARASAASFPAPLFLTADELPAQFGPLTRDENQAWRELARAWQLTLVEPDPCAEAQRSAVQCFRSSNSTLALIRQLDRPGILTLHDARDHAVYALLTGLSRDAATLRIGGVTQNISLVSLATLWRGDFATLWRAPAGYDGRVAAGADGAVGGWVAGRLEALHATSAPAPGDGAGWRARIAAFQLSQGLKADGLAGPTTFMQLNRTSGIAEPQLRSDPRVLTP